MVNDEEVIIMTVNWNDDTPPIVIEPDTPFRTAANILVNLMVCVYDHEPVVLAVNRNFLDHTRNVYCIELFVPPTNEPKVSVTAPTEYEALFGAQAILADRYCKMLGVENTRQIPDSIRKLITQ